ncbi:hypothetical protein GCM10007904_00970 [Oharaeibacter diazotrophicus]|nr:hypothetical protein GCM10007904_00970 [Oharaeibacter diazotrophicus]
MVRAVIKPGFAALTSFERGTADRSGLESALRELAATVLVSGAMPDALIAPIRAVHDFLLSSPAFREIEWGPVRPPEVEIVSRRTGPEPPRPLPTGPVGERRHMLIANSWERSALGRRLLGRVDKGYSQIGFGLLQGRSLLESGRGSWADDG